MTLIRRNSPEPLLERRRVRQEAIVHLVTEVQSFLDEWRTHHSGSYEYIKKTLAEAFARFAHEATRVVPVVISVELSNAQRSRIETTLCMWQSTVLGMALTGEEVSFVFAKVADALDAEVAQYVLAKCEGALAVWEAQRYSNVVYVHTFGAKHKRAS